MLIDVFNEAYNNIAAGYLKVVGDSMSAIRFLVTVKGELPHLSYISRYQEPWEADFKTVACSAI